MGELRKTRSSRTCHETHHASWRSQFCAIVTGYKLPRLQIILKKSSTPWKAKMARFWNSRMIKMTTLWKTPSCCEKCNRSWNHAGLGPGSNVPGSNGPDRLWYFFSYFEHFNCCNGKFNLTQTGLLSNKANAAWKIKLASKCQNSKYKKCFLTAHHQPWKGRLNLSSRCFARYHECRWADLKPWGSRPGMPTLIQVSIG